MYNANRVRLSEIDIERASERGVDWKRKNQTEETEELYAIVCGMCVRIRYVMVDEEKQLIDEGREEGFT